MWRMINVNECPNNSSKSRSLAKLSRPEVVVVEGKIGFEANYDVNASIWHTSIEKSVLK